MSQEKIKQALTILARMKIRTEIRRRGDGFAGLWEEWLDKQTSELTETCTIITTEANDVLIRESSK